MCEPQCQVVARINTCKGGVLLRKNQSLRNQLVGEVAGVIIIVIIVIINIAREV